MITGEIQTIRVPRWQSPLKDPRSKKFCEAASLEMDDDKSRFDERLKKLAKIKTEPYDDPRT